MCLANLHSLSLDQSDVPPGTVRDVAAGVDLAIILPAGALGEAERARLAADLAAARAEAERVRARLADAAFVERAPEDVVAGARQQLHELERKSALLAETLELGG
jgi:valyl-tRNA synthetase